MSCANLKCDFFGQEYVHRSICTSLSKYHYFGTCQDFGCARRSRHLRGHAKCVIATYKLAQHCKRSTTVEEQKRSHPGLEPRNMSQIARRNTSTSALTRLVVTTRRHTSTSKVNDSSLKVIYNDRAPRRIRQPSTDLQYEVIMF